MLFQLSAGVAGCLVLGHTTLTKMMQTILWRGPGSKAAQLGADNWMQVKDKLEKIPLYQIMSAAHLNEAEYAGPLSAALLFCHATNVQVPIAAALAVFGQVGYYWPRVVRRGATPSRDPAAPTLTGILASCTHSDSCGLRVCARADSSSPATRTSTTASHSTCPARWRATRRWS